MKTETYTTIRRVLRVRGFIWSGGKCEHEYPLNDSQQPDTLQDAKRIAGDFESLTSATIETVEREVKKTTTRKTLKAARDTVTEGAR